MTIYLSLLLLTWSAISFASELCIKTNEDIRTLLTQESSRIAFQNTGGLFNGGVCWWHSRLQRASAYLIEFNPAAEKKSTKEEAKEILLSLREMNQTVVINGYSNFLEFTADHKNEVQKMLEVWQQIDGFFNFEWIRGISGKSSLPANEMNVRMKSIFEAYNNSPTPIWMMLQIKGITSHSMLVLHMEEFMSGYRISAIDSNNPLTEVVINYLDGDTDLKPQGENYRFVPYLGFQNDFRKISSALSKRCGNSYLIDGAGIIDGEIEKY